jgi:hypothetical protein
MEAKQQRAQRRNEQDIDKVPREAVEPRSRTHGAGDSSATGVRVLVLREGSTTELCELWELWELRL